MRKIKLMLVIVLFILLTSCSRSIMTKDSLLNEITEIEELFKGYAENILDVNMDKTFAFTYENEATKGSFTYYFGIVKDEKKGLYVETYTKPLEQNQSERTTCFYYYNESKKYYSRLRGLDEFIEQGTIEYETFSRKYLKPELCCFNLDFSQLKEFSFVDFHTFTPSAESELTFNEEYHYIYKDDDLNIDITNVVGEVRYRAGTGWEIADFTINGVNNQNEKIRINWFLDY